MNRFDEKYEIRLALYDEITDIMSFIDTYWKKGHILARDRKFFEYEMVVDGQVNFLIAKSKANGNIEGILGFLPCSKNQEKLDLWGVVWKTLPGAMPMLGMELKKRLMIITGARTDLGVGANLGTSIPLLKRIYHYYTAKMKHYYRLADCKDYKVALISDKTKMGKKTADGLEVKLLNNVDELEDFYNFEKEVAIIPYKDSWYYKKRFFEHPIYKYSVWGLIKQEKKAILITRVQEYNGSSVIRIVDYLGEQYLFSYCGDFLDSLLKEHEYIDFYFDGFDERYVIDAGMSEVDEHSCNIIPDYFNPYEPVNVDIYVDSSNNIDKCVFFKADGDQDRPN